MSTGVTELDRPVPLYMQIVRQIRAQIASGELRDGGRLPSQREMMARWHVSMQTASKVIGAMKTEGLAVPSVGRDTVVAPGAAARIAAAPGAAGRHPGKPTIYHPYGDADQSAQEVDPGIGPAGRRPGRIAGTARLSWV